MTFETKYYIEKLHAKYEVELIPDADVVFVFIQYKGEFKKDYFRLGLKSSVDVGCVTEADKFIKENEELCNLIHLMRIYSEDFSTGLSESFIAINENSFSDLAKSIIKQYK